MFYKNKLKNEITSLLNPEILSIELKLEVYNEIVDYLEENNCTQGVNLISKVREKMINYISDLKTDLREIENIFCELSNILKKNNNKEDYKIKKIKINNKEIFMEHIEDKYIFIYPIGFDNYKKLYKHGIIEAKINKTIMQELSSKIVFSEESDLSKYLDFKEYFNDLLSNLRDAESLEDLDLVMKDISDELIKIFYLENLRDICIKRYGIIEKTKGISGVEIYSTLYENYNTYKMKLKLNIIGYLSTDNRVMELIKLELSQRKLLIEINKEDIGDYYDEFNNIINKQEEEIKVLMKETSMNKVEINNIINKINLIN